MDLEQRVQALEQELQILKNQIQVTLLDIQEQLLSNTYPGLRSGDAPQQSNPASSRVSPEPEEPGRPAAPVRKVSFSALGDEQTSAAQTPPTISQSQSSNHNWQAMAELEAWASEKIEAIGVEQTGELIEMYATKGRFNEDTRDILLEFVALYGRNQQELVTRPTRPAPFETAPRSPQGGRTQATAGNPVQPSQSKSVKAAPAQKPVKPAPVQPPAQAATAQPKAAKPKAKQPPAKVTIVAKASPAADKRKDRNVVLKLIAGVQNAGAGVRWGKRNG